MIPPQHDAPVATVQRRWVWEGVSLILIGIVGFGVLERALLKQAAFISATSSLVWGVVIDCLFGWLLIRGLAFIVKGAILKARGKK